MKRMRMVTFLIVLFLTGCLHRYYPPEPTYYGDSQYHCYVYNPDTLKIYEGVNVNQDTATSTAMAQCRAVSKNLCEFDTCVQR